MIAAYPVLVLLVLEPSQVLVQAVLQNGSVFGHFCLCAGSLHSPRVLVDSKYSLSDIHTLSSVCFPVLVFAVSTELLCSLRLLNVESRPGCGVAMVLLLLHQR